MCQGHFFNQFKEISKIYCQKLKDIRHNLAQISVCAGLAKISLVSAHFVPVRVRAKIVSRLVEVGTDG